MSLWLGSRVPMTVASSKAAQYPCFSVVFKSFSLWDSMSSHHQHKIRNLSVDTPRYTITLLGPRWTGLPYSVLDVSFANRAVSTSSFSSEPYTTVVIFWVLGINRIFFGDIICGIWMGRLWSDKGSRSRAHCFQMYFPLLPMWGYPGSQTYCLGKHGKLYLLSLHIPHDHSYALRTTGWRKT